jgi:ketosteroid isomerase-like protein
MSSLEPVRVVLQFIEHINRQSPDDLASLMIEEHLFIDSVGSQFRGREQLRAGWKQYFSMFPDYAMNVESTLVNENVVAAFGTASGTLQVRGALLPENHWQIPFAVRAVTLDGKVAEWRIFADNHPVMEIIARNK